MNTKLDYLTAMISWPIPVLTMTNANNTNEDNTNDGFWTGDILEEEAICLAFEEDQSLLEQDHQ